MQNLVHQPQILANFVVANQFFNFAMETFKVEPPIIGHLRKYIGCNDAVDLKISA